MTINPAWGLADRVHEALLEVGRPVSFEWLCKRFAAGKPASRKALSNALYALRKRAFAVFEGQKWRATTKRPPLAQPSKPIDQPEPADQGRLFDDAIPAIDALAKRLQAPAPKPLEHAARRASVLRRLADLLDESIASELRAVAEWVDASGRNPRGDGGC